MFDFLPAEIAKSLSLINYENIYELRIRAGGPIVINYLGEKYFLSYRGLTFNATIAYIASLSEIEQIIYNLCNNAIYAHTEEIRKGYISYTGGIRVGICGQCVSENDSVLNIKSITSINVRFPHAINGFADSIISYFNNSVRNTLIIAKPGAGKTTLVRDLAEQIYTLYNYNIFVIDERGEIFPCMKNKEHIDCLSYSPKSFAFSCGIRVMAPDVIITDELTTQDDFLSLYRVSKCGVKIMATLHGEGLEALRVHEFINTIKNTFEIFVFIDIKNCNKRMLKIYDKSCL